MPLARQTYERGDCTVKGSFVREKWGRGASPRRTGRVESGKNCVPALRGRRERNNLQASPRARVRPFDFGVCG